MNDRCPLCGEPGEPGLVGFECATDGCVNVSERLVAARKAALERIKADLQRAWDLETGGIPFWYLP